jgi:hypothetical protein
MVIQQRILLPATGCQCCRAVSQATATPTSLSLLLTQYMTRCRRKSTEQPCCGIPLKICILSFAETTNAGSSAPASHKNNSESSHLPRMLHESQHAHTAAEVFTGAFSLTACHRVRLCAATQHISAASHTGLKTGYTSVNKLAMHDTKLTVCNRSTICGVKTQLPCPSLKLSLTTYGVLSHDLQDYLHIPACCASNKDDAQTLNCMLNTSSMHTYPGAPLNGCCTMQL